MDRLGLIEDINKDMPKSFNVEYRQVLNSMTDLQLMCVKSIINTLK